MKHEITCDMGVDCTCGGSTEAHTRLVTEARERWGGEPDLVLWGNSKVSWIRGRAVAKPGLQTGASDIIGILSITTTRRTYRRPYAESEGWKWTFGVFCAFEAKTGGARQTAAQRRFAELVRSRGGFACVFRSVEEFGEALERARRGERK